MELLAPVRFPSSARPALRRPAAPSTRRVRRLREHQAEQRIVPPAARTPQGLIALSPSVDGMCTDVLPSSTRGWSSGLGEKQAAGTV
jgi:hypothetical protein